MMIGHAVLRRAATALLFLTAAIGFAAAPAMAQDDFSAGQEERIREVVRDYILENPDVIMEALRTLEQRRRDEAAQRQRDALIAMRDRLYNDARDVAVGPMDPEAAKPVSLVEFFDYQCGYCKRVFPAVMQAMHDDPGLRVVFIELPILGPVSTFAARAALASKKQDRYFDMHRAVMNERGRLTEARVMEIAGELGLDVDRLRADMDDPAITDHIRDNIQLAQALGIDGTPAMVIGDQLIPGAIGLDQLKELIAQTRAGQG